MMHVTDIFYLYEHGGKKDQEDFIWPLPGEASVKDTCFIVCDGVGGSERGEVASRLVAEHVGRKIGLLQDNEVTESAVFSSLEEAQGRLNAYAEANRLNTDMATTFTFLKIIQDRVLLVWCGDSRIYHLRNGKVLYKTTDHSLVNLLVKNGDITETEALTHPRKNVILKAIRADKSVIDAEAHWIDDLADGDCFMLCTDGLLEHVREAHLYELLKPGADSSSIVSTLQSICKDRTRDNYSMYLLRTTKAAASKPRSTKGILLVLLLITLISSLSFVFYISSNNQTSLQIDNGVSLPTRVTDTSDDALFEKAQNPVVDSYPIGIKDTSSFIKGGKLLTNDTSKQNSNKVPSKPIVKRSTPNDTDSVMLSLIPDPSVRPDSLKADDSLQRKTLNR